MITTTHILAAVDLSDASTRVIAYAWKNGATLGGQPYCGACRA